MSCRLGSCQHPPATSTLQLSVSPHVLCQTFAHLTFDVSMEGSGRVHTRCSSPRKYSRKPGPHHMRRILRILSSFPRRRESIPWSVIPSAYCHSPPSPFVQGEGCSRRRRESSPSYGPV